MCLDDTHDSFSDSPQPLRPQSEFETVRDGRRYASHGQPLPDDAPPQRHRNWFWTEAWYDAHVAPKRSGHKAKEQKMKKITIIGQRGTTGSQKVVILQRRKATKALCDVT